MKDLESLTKQLEHAFKEKIDRKMDFNVYLAKSAVDCLKFDSFINALTSVKRNFELNFNLSFDYRFLPAPDAEPLPDTLRKMLNESKKLKYNKRDMTYEDVSRIETQYNAQKGLIKSFDDYKFLFQENGCATKGGLHCMISGLEACYNKGSNSEWGVYAIATQPGNFIMASISRVTERELENILLHEIGHCFGAEHTWIPFSIMRSGLGYFHWWDPYSKHTIMESIEKHLKSDVQ